MIRQDKRQDKEIAISRFCLNKLLRYVLSFKATFKNFCVTFDHKSPCSCLKVPNALPKQKISRAFRISFPTKIILNEFFLPIQSFSDYTVDITKNRVMHGSIRSDNLHLLTSKVSKISYVLQQVHKYLVEAVVMYFLRDSNIQLCKTCRFLT